MWNNLYDTLWVSKTSTQDEIKKAYRKLAMQYHPDRNKWDAQAEQKFKEINQAYEVLWDDEKRKNYDRFWSTSGAWNPFWWGGYSTWWVNFEDLFSHFGQQQSSRRWFSGGFDFSDLFWSSWNSYKQQSQTTSESIDIEKTYEVPVFDLILWCKIEVQWFLWQTAKLKIPANTKPGTKFRVKDFGKNIWWRKWNLIVNIDVRMPKRISEIDLQLLENIRENIWY